MMDYQETDWHGVAYIESEKKLIFTEHSLDELPDAIFNLMYHNEVCQADFSNNGLRTLAGLQPFVNLTDLILDNNYLNDCVKIPKIRGLTTLSLNNNKITNLNILLLRLSANMPNIEYLSLLGNPACPDQLSAAGPETTNNPQDDYQHYRYCVINTLTKLKFLDSGRISLAERQRARDYAIANDDGYNSTSDDICLIAREFFQRLLKWPITVRDSNIYSPLPNDFQAPGYHQGSYGKRKYRYCGQHSEGNRFIANGDL